MIISADETSYFSPSTEYQLSVYTVLLPTGFHYESAGVLPLHLDLGFPDEINNVTVFDAVDEVFWKRG